MGLVFNAGTKLDYRLPGISKYLPAFRVAGADGNAGQSHSLTVSSADWLDCSKLRAVQGICTKGPVSRYPGRRPRSGVATATLLHSTSLLCIVIADPKMVDTEDVTPPQAPVDISMKDLRIGPSL